ncbi:hypothetical protein T492DRAFT_1098523 [Pavlovales sp. CCMP2436]|nr:hypothetical protein T492DRAFT_1098523 [Pavlovales sp. CCMP2436]
MVASRTGTIRRTCSAPCWLRAVLALGLAGSAHALAGSSVCARFASRAAAAPRARVTAAEKRGPDFAARGAGIAGAVAGGLLLGPLGVFFGAQLGANFGGNREAANAELQRLERMGLSPKDLALLQEVVRDVKEADESLQLVADAANGARARVEALESEASVAYTEAGDALGAGDEAGARRWLERRERAQESLARAREIAVDADARVSQMQASAGQLQQRAEELSQLTSRTIAAAAEARRAAADERDGRSGSGAAGREQASDTLPPADSWEARFRDLER